MHPEPKQPTGLAGGSPAAVTVPSTGPARTPGGTRAAPARSLPPTAPEAQPESADSTQQAREDVNAQPEPSEAFNYRTPQGASPNFQYVSTSNLGGGSCSGYFTATRLQLQSTSRPQPRRGQLTTAAGTGARRVTATTPATDPADQPARDLVT